MRIDQSQALLWDDNPQRERNTTDEVCKCRAVKSSAPGSISTRGAWGTLDCRAGGPAKRDWNAPALPSTAKFSARLDGGERASSNQSRSVQTWTGTLVETWLGSHTDSKHWCCGIHSWEQAYVSSYSLFKKKSQNGGAKGREQCASLSSITSPPAAEAASICAQCPPVFATCC